MKSVNFSNKLHKAISVGIVSAFLFLCDCNLFSFEELLFRPLTANHLESRIGTFYQHTEERLRLDIGHSLDLFEITNTGFLMRIGGDFFILSRLRSDGRMKFPVETADYYFGFNWSSKFSKDNLNQENAVLNNLSFRVRVAHISSHLIDGYTKENVFIKEPFVFSREFVDVVIAYDWDFVRMYIGCNSIFSSLPRDANRFVPQIGFDFKYPLLNDNIDIVGGYDLKLIGTDNAVDIGCNSIQAGVHFNLSKNIGISLNYYYYSGYSIHGMFYDEKDKYQGIGIEINY